MLKNRNLILTRVAFGAAALVAVASPAVAGRECTVQFSVTSATSLGALQFSVDYAAAGDVGDFAAGGCTIVPAGISDVDVDQSTDDLGIGWASTSAFNGPGVFATCAFIVPDDASTDPVAGDFPISINDASTASAPPAPANPTMVAAVTGCVASTPECLNGILEDGEECDDGNADGGDGCGPTCASTGSCSSEPLAGCKVPTVIEKSKLSFKNDASDLSSDVKDQGQYQWKSGAATDVSEFEDPTTAGETWSWCVYDDGVVVKGVDVPSGAGWAAAGTTGFQFKGDVGGVAQIKLKAGVSGKASVAVKAKSKLGNFHAPLPLSASGTIVSQLVKEGLSTACFQSTAGTPSKNDASSFGAKGNP
jgi:cysteine-rich repeat protein